MLEIKEQQIVKNYCFKNARVDVLNKKEAYHAISYMKVHRKNAYLLESN